MKDFFHLKKNLKKDFTGLPAFRLALLGDTATQFLSEALRGMAFERCLNLQVWEADYNQIERQILDPTSELYRFRPEIVVIFRSAHKLLGKYNKLPSAQQSLLASTELQTIENLYTTLANQLPAKVIYYNYTEIDDAVFGNYASKTPSSFLFQLRKLNYELMLLSARHPDLHLCDISTLQNQLGKTTFFQSSIYINTDMVLSVDILPRVASKTLDLIAALQGKVRKCVILDLDNTIWGGVIGDDGIENLQLGSLGIGKAFSEFQYWLRKLKNRGIILAVCSKNTESVAKEPFQQHPDMVLQLDDIAVFIANWGNKVDNILQIQSVLNIGFDSMVFIDDNPFERNLVRENIPDICVPEMPPDPADYLEFLYSLNLFETASFSEEDERRTGLYKIESQRKAVRQKFANEDDFLKSLHMLSQVEAFNKFNAPRVAQLSHRSNQFNLRTVRYSETDIKAMITSADHFTFAFSLEDKFGDNGMICVVILQKESSHTLFIDSWFMSCRVLNRGMEHFVLNEIANFGRENGFAYLKGEYLPTAKNEMVKNHYPGLGFNLSGNYWMLELEGYTNKKCFINKKNYGKK